MKSKRSTQIFIWIVIITGLVACGIAICNLPYNNRLDLRFAFLAVFTIAFGSRLSLQLPRSKFHFLMSDGLISLTFLLYGGEAAMLLATGEALSASLRMKGQGVKLRYTTVLFNGALMACATAATFVAVIFYAKFASNATYYINLADFIAHVSIAEFINLY